MEQRRSWRWCWPLVLQWNTCMEKSRLSVMQTEAWRKIFHGSTRRWPCAGEQRKPYIFPIFLSTNSIQRLLTFSLPPAWARPLFSSCLGDCKSRITGIPVSTLTLNTILPGTGMIFWKPKEHAIPLCNILLQTHTSCRAKPRRLTCSHPLVSPLPLIFILIRQPGTFPTSRLFALPLIPSEASFLQPVTLNSTCV